MAGPTTPGTLTTLITVFVLTIMFIQSIARLGLYQAYSRIGRQSEVLVGCRRGSQLRIQVWDTGSGIAPEEQARVFQECYQIGNPERDRTRGVGLGLAIVKRLTTLLDHRLQLRSWLGKGTCFSIDVPRERLATRQSRRNTRGSPPCHTDRIKEAEASGYLLLHKPVPNEVLRDAIARLTLPAEA
jgi:K+-sensing histidine kinase KdpD